MGLDTKTDWPSDVCLHVTLTSAFDRSGTQRKGDVSRLKPPPSNGSEDAAVDASAYA
jgi:hypothetical protein